MARIYLSPPHMGPDERALLLDAFDSNWIAPLGPHVDAFEREFAARVGVPHAVALSSGTAALHLSLLLLGVERNDEVFVSTFTFAATANAITYVGAKPVFIDSERRTWNMDADLLDGALLARRPKAVIVVDLYGQCAEYDRILPVCAKHGVPVIQDAAEALGADYKGKPAGSFGAFGVFSFNGNKIITTSGGGMLVTESKDFAEKARFLSTQARDPAPHYEHSTIGYNYRLSNLLAAVGRGQLRALDERIRARRAVRSFYARELADLPGVELMPTVDGATCWLTCILVDAKKFGATPARIREAFEKEDIESRPLWKPMHMQPVFAKCETIGGDVTRDLFERGLCLPSGSSLSETDLQRIVQVLKRVSATG